MKAPVKWLEEYAGIEVSMEELVEKLTLRGLEVEGIKKGKTGEVIEIELTPNRGDCASIYGIIREISAIYDIEYKEPETDYREINESIRDNFKLENRIPEKCPAYYLKYIKNVKVEDSPQWIKNRLRDCGIRPQNNVVDITNYVLMELGQPLHAFDASKIKNNKIIVRKGINQEKITTLDDKQANVNKEDIIIGDNEKAVAIGGVMGGKDTCVTESTTDILLESAFFKPESISETEKRLNIKSESSYRFARHIDEKGIKRGLDRAAHLIQKICSGEPTRDELCFDNTKDEFKKIYLQKKKIKNILGIEIKDKEIKNNMERLNFKVEDNGSEVKFSVPSYRNDVTRDIDIIEEIARMHGYENIEPTLPESKIDTRFINKPDIYKISEEILKSFNYWQIVTPTIINSKTPITDNERRNCVELSNPVNVSMDLMRHNILPGILDVCYYNINQKQDNIRFYERGPVYIKNKDKHKEFEQLAFASIGNDFFESKKIINSILKNLRQEYEISYGNDSIYFDAEKSGKIEINGNFLGEFGCFNDDYLNYFKLKNNFIGGYIFIYNLNEDSIINKKYIPWSPFPSVFMDISLVVPIGLTHSEIYDNILKVNVKNLKKILLTDQYKKGDFGQDKKSMTYSLEFNSPEKTLTSEEIESNIKKIIKHLNKEIGAELRER